MRFSRRDRTRAPEPSGLDLDALDLEELLEPELAELAAVPRLLDAAERREWIERRAVDLDLPRAHPPCEGLRALGIGRPDAAVQAVDGRVRDLRGLVLG